MPPIQSLQSQVVSETHQPQPPGAGCVAATPSRCPLWGRRTPGAPGSTPGRRGCGDSASHLPRRAAARPPPCLGLPISPRHHSSAVPTTTASKPQSHPNPPSGQGACTFHARGHPPIASHLTFSLTFVQTLHTHSPSPHPQTLHPGPSPQLGPPSDATHPTLWATGLIDSWETKTWQAKRLSRGCFVMKPK